MIKKKKTQCIAFNFMNKAPNASAFTGIWAELSTWPNYSEHSHQQISVVDGKTSEARI